MRLSETGGRTSAWRYDSGPGIHPNVLPAHFDAFTTTKALGEGYAGLGLWASYAIVEQHQGAPAPPTGSKAARRSSPSCARRDLSNA